MTASVPLRARDFSRRPASDGRGAGARVGRRNDEIYQADGGCDPPYPTCSVDPPYVRPICVNPPMYGRKASGIDIVPSTF